MKPTRRALVLASIPLVCGGIATFVPEVIALFWAALGGFGLVLAARMLAATRITLPTITRSVPASLPVGVSRQITLRIVNQGKHPLWCAVHDLYPQTCEVEGLPREVLVPKASALDVVYAMRPLERGDLVFSGPELLMREPWGLVERRVRFDQPSIVHVFPNFAAVARFALHAVEDAVRQLGLRRRRRRGEGMDFDHLREYRIGDTQRQIDWKATSRRRRLITRQFREERDQRVVFLLDCGRRMRTKDGELSHFDHALNAVLLLTYVALRQGDSVGLLASGGLERWMPLVKGRSGLTALLERVYDLQPTLAPFDPLEAARRLLENLPRRALVVWITNLRDVDADEVQPALRLLRKKHFVVVASMREAVVDRLASAEIRDMDSALLAAAATGYRQERAQALAKIDARGLLLLDVTPEELPRKIVNRYLEIKRAGAL